MENSLINGLQKDTNITETENGMKAFKTTNSSLLNLFGTVGGLRNRQRDVGEMFGKAISEDELLALKLLFYTRDIRGGLGERDTFRTALKYIAEWYPQLLKPNINLIPEFGRWDDLYALIGTSLEDDAFSLIKVQLTLDIINYKENKPTSVLAKWLKSNTKVSKNSKKLGEYTAKKLGMTQKEYRVLLSRLRKHINIVEAKMSKNDWDIEFENVPGLAMKKYRKAFERHGMETFSNFIEKVEKGEAEIKAQTLYPYDIIGAAGLGRSRTKTTGEEYFKITNLDKVLQLQWDNLPNYIEGENNILIMADTSASMKGRPMETSIGLAVYFAERNQGVWKDKFMTFSSKPSFIKLQGSTLAEKISCVPSIVDDTDIEAAFLLILKTARKYNVEKNEMPKAIVIITDGEFNRMVIDSSGHNTFMEAMEQKFFNAGYKLPKIVFWNVESRQNIYHAISDKANVAMVSGQSTSTFKTVLNSTGENPYDVMLETLNNERYNQITI